MGIYLNSLSAHTLYRNEMRKPYFVDKTAMLEELFPLIREGSNYICVTRPRRFGKTVIANMISSFFGKGADSHEIFDRLSIADAKEYREYLNTPQAAIRQIKDRRYALRFQGLPGKPSPYTGRILAVGITYDKKHKRHQ